MDGERQSVLIPVAMVTLTIVLCTWAFLWMSDVFEQDVHRRALADDATSGDAVGFVAPRTEAAPQPPRWSTHWNRGGLQIRYDHDPAEADGASISFDVKLSDLWTTVRNHWSD